MAVAATALAAGIERDAVAEGLRTFAGVPHRLERVGERDGVQLRQRLEGDQRRRRRGRPAQLRRRGPGDPRRQPQGRRLRGARPGGRRALPRLLPDRGGGARARHGPRPGGRAAGPLRRPRDRASPAPRRTPGRARRCCWPPPAPASTPSATTRSAATASASSSRPSARRARERDRRDAARRLRPPAGQEAQARGGAQEGAPGRVLAAADRDDVPGRLRRGDGLQRQLERLAARRVRRRHLLPEANADVRRDRPGRAAGALDPGDARHGAAPHPGAPRRRDRAAAA